jgi:hypothetical protein
MKTSAIAAAAGLAALLGAQLACAQAVQVCAPFDAHGKAHINDDLFDGKASTTSADLTGFCMSLTGPGLGQTGPTRFTINTVPSDVSGSCQATGEDATRIAATCDDDVVTKLKGKVK